MLLELQEISKRFGGLQAVDNVSLKVREGEIVALIGPNGAGKTTLFNLVTGFLHPDTGAIRFAGQPIHDLRPHRITRLGLCRTFQVVKPFRGLSVLENVAIGAYLHTASRAQAHKIARQVVEQLGLAPYMDQPARSLPIGLKKRLELARALATRPKLLFLDEVMGGLTSAEIAELTQFLHGLPAQGITLLFIEHHMHAVMSLAQRVVVLHYGRKIAEGTPAEISHDPQVIEAYLGSGEE